MRVVSTRSASGASPSRSCGRPLAFVFRSTWTPAHRTMFCRRKTECGNGFEDVLVGAVMRFSSYRARISRLGRIQRMPPDNWPVPHAQQGGRVAKGLPILTTASGVTGSDDDSRSITGATVAGGEIGSSQAQPRTHFGTEMTRNR
mgnify:CR=1 FL=1